MVAGAASCVVFARWRVGGRFGAGMVSVRQKDRWLCVMYPDFFQAPSLLFIAFHSSTRPQGGGLGPGGGNASHSWRVTGSQQSVHIFQYGLVAAIDWSIVR